MPHDSRFWRNVTIIALLHIAAVLGLWRWNRETKKPAPNEITWITGGAGDGAGDAAATEATGAEKVQNATEPTPPPAVDLPTPEPPEMKKEQPDVPPAKSEIQLPESTPTPPPTATPKAKPAPTDRPTPKPTATPRPSPKPTPKATPKPKPKPSPSPKKTVVAKAKPKPSATAAAKAEEAADDSPAKSKTAGKQGDHDGSTAGKAIKKATAAHGGGAGSGAGKSGAGGPGSGSGGASEFGWYGSMLHDRFYGEWVQPTTNVAAGSKMSTIVKLRISKDGKVSSFEIVQPSGNGLVDESVAAVAKRVTQVDPLPNGLGNGEFYEVKINFELNAEP